MRLFLLLALALPLAAAEAEKPRQLESVTIRIEPCRLVWTVSEGRREDGKYVPERLIDYAIDLHDATMVLDSAPTDVRHFEEEEAAAVHRLVEALSQYAAESTVWYEMGKGKVKPKAAPAKGNNSVAVRFQAPARGKR